MRRVAVVTGPGGVGKSELLLQTAHRAVGRGWFPGGILSIDLQGYSEDLAPLPPGDALGRLLRLLGLSLKEIPEHPHDRAAVYRESLEGRSVLVFLDNARDSAQVRPLLPPEGGAALVSSRHRLPALEDVGRLTLGVLPPETGSELFLTAAGPHTGANSDRAVTQAHARRIAVGCGGFPLALRVAAARVRGESSAQLAELAEWLDDERNRLMELDDGERTVTAVFRPSYDGLDDDHRELFALCGLHPGPRLDIHALAALADLPLREARRRMQVLHNAHLVEPDGAHQYKLHDLLHAYARTRVHEDVAENRVRAAMDRLIDFYLCTADRADLAVAPGRYRLPHTIAHPPHSTPDVDDRSAALAWFVDELPQLTALMRAAATTSDPSRCWLLADAMRGFFFHAKFWDSWLETLQVALDVATDAGELQVQGIMHNGMGVALVELGRSRDAARHYAEAEARFEAVGDRHGVATAVENRAWVHQYGGEHLAALADHRRALDEYRNLGADRNTAIVQRGMALAEIELGRYEDATANLTQALDAFLALGLELDAVMALNGLGEAHARAGDTETACHYHRQALSRSRDCENVFEEARARSGLAALLAPANPRLAADHWRRALAVYESVRSPLAEQVRTALEGLGLPSTNEDDSSAGTAPTG
ncbi:tetratricopeptide repeat protein [Streptomyces sp. NPDC057253]|uniref:tetratricopeptide repeat protein n=1 Tax=Streptomyces sp. NPDC057253 TaxID=3346069 RepID=UPI00362E8148